MLTRKTCLTASIRRRAKLTSESQTPAPVPEAAAQLEFARRIALDLLAVRQRSRYELSAALRRRGVPDEVASELLGRLGEVGLVDDAAFAETVTTSRSQFGMRGRARIRQELQAKGVDRATVEAALAELDPESERAAALALAYRRARSMGQLDRQVARRRLAGVLARRGYAPGIVAAVVGEVLNDPAVEFSTGEQ